jgi:hypothetical protein
VAVGSRAGSAGIGGSLAARDTILRVAVRAAPWVPISDLRVYRDARLVHHGSIHPGTPVELPMRFERDAFITVEVRGEPGELYRAVAPGFVPFAFSNPIFVDADADGRFSAPGLPPQPLPLLERPRVEAPTLR